MADEPDPLTGHPDSFPRGPETPGDPSQPQEALQTPAFGPAPLRFYVSAHTDIGCVRTNNEDAYRFDQEFGIYVVCDGMGGGPSGEVSSAIAVETIAGQFAASHASGASVGTRLLQAIEAANTAVCVAAEVPENKGMGTTAVVAALNGDEVIIANVGDSRAYMIRGGQCTQLTVDHSYRNELIRKGQLSVDEAMSINLEGMESVICRALGAASSVEPDFFSAPMDRGSAILLATDGLTRYLLQDEILAVISESSFDSACLNLVEEAKQRGGADNITCMLLLAAASKA